MSEVTEMIELARGGDRAAADQVFAALYGELKRLARGQLHGADVPMHATSLVHEAYCRLVRADELR